MRIFLEVLGGLATIAFFLFVAFAVNRGFEEIVVGGLALVYATVRYEARATKYAVFITYYGQRETNMRVANNIKGKFLKKDTEQIASEVIPQSDEAIEKQKVDLGVQAGFTIIMTVLSLGLIIKGVLAY